MNDTTYNAPEQQALIDFEEEFGYVSLYRKFLDWEWYSDVNCSRLFIHLLLKANYRDNTWRGILVKRGQHITSLETLADKASLTVQQIRTTLNKLKSTGDITIAPTSKYTLITITKYEQYQNTNKQINKGSTRIKQTNNKQITTNNKENKISNDIYKEEFIELFKVYPKQVGETEAYKAYVKARKVVTLEIIVDGVSRYLEYLNKNNTDLKYVKKFSNWLRDKCWNDQYNIAGLRPALNSPVQPAKNDVTSPDFFDKAYGGGQ